VALRYPIYLDTARLCPPSRKALASVSSFIARESLSPRFDDLLRQGFDALPAAYRRYSGGVCAWKGVAEFRRSLCGLIGTEQDGTTVLAGRTAQLMRLSARLLSVRCNRALVTDLEWPGFGRILGHDPFQSGISHRRGSRISSPGSCG
jgi:hypothetical protein